MNSSFVQIYPETICSCGFDELIALKVWPLLHLRQCNHFLKSKDNIFKKTKDNSKFLRYAITEHYSKRIRIKGIKLDMDMMKRKQLTSKDGGDVKATKTDDQEQA